MEDLILIGFGGHAKSVLDTIERQGKYCVKGFIDRVDKTHYRGYKVLGNDNDLCRIYQSGVKNAFITIGYLGESEVRNQIYSTLKKIGYNIPKIIDDTATIASDVIVGEGTYIGKNVIINSAAQVGNMCIINTGAIVEHDCFIDDFSHIAVGAVICGGVHIGQEGFIGANATIVQTLEIGDKSKVGAGAIVLKDVPSNQLVCGLWKGIEHGEDNE